MSDFFYFNFVNIKGGLVFLYTLFYVSKRFNFIFTLCRNNASYFLMEMNGKVYCR